MSSELSASRRFCERLARREAKNFYPCFWLLPPSRRQAMCALYAFLRETDDITDTRSAGDRETVVRRLSEWEADLEKAAADRELGPWPGWPALVAAMREHGAPFDTLFDSIRGVRMDLEKTSYQSFDELREYCRLVASVVGVACLHIWGYESHDGEAERLAEDCGLALQLTNILRDVREDAEMGRIYLPREDMARFGVSAEALLHDHAEGPLRALLAFEAERAYAYYESAGRLAEWVHPRGRPILRAITGVYRRLLDEIRARDFDVLAGRISIGKFRKAGVLLKAIASSLAPTAPPWNRRELGMRERRT